MIRITNKSMFLDTIETCPNELNININIYNI